MADILRSAKYCKASLDPGPDVGFCVESLLKGLESGGHLTGRLMVKSYSSGVAAEQHSSLLLLEAGTDPVLPQPLALTLEGRARFLGLCWY